jgi:hypothetical protein
VKQCVKDLLEDNPFATWAMIAEALPQRCQLNASRSTAARLLKKAGYTRKTACRVVNKVIKWDGPELEPSHFWQAGGFEGLHGPAWATSMGAVKPVVVYVFECKNTAENPTVKNL